jgi:hypothetical protein
MASRIKKDSSLGDSKELKIKDTKSVEKVVSKNKKTIVTGTKSNAVRKKPVVRKVNQESNVNNDNKPKVVSPSNNKTTSNKNTKSKHNKEKKNNNRIEKVVIQTEEKIKEIELDNKDEDNNEKVKLFVDKIEEKKEEQEIKEEEKVEEIPEKEREKETEQDKEIEPDLIIDTFSKTNEEKDDQIEITNEKNDNKKNLSKNKLSIPGNRKSAINFAKNKKTKKVQVKKTPTPEKNVKSVIKPDDVPEENIPVIEVKKEEISDIKTIKTDKIDNIKKKAKEKNKPKVTKLKPKDTIKTGKRVKSVYDPNLNRWVVKEDKSKPVEKKKKKNYGTPSIDNDYTYELETGGLKSKFFEEVNVERYTEAKRQKRRKYPKRILIFALVVLILVSGGYLFYKKYQDKIKHDLNMYDVYEIGEQVKLTDDSVWFVADKTDGSMASVLLLSSTLTDVNEDGHIDDNDKKQYSSGNYKYDVKDESSIAYYLENELKPKLENKIGKINSISMIDSKVFVRIRDKFQYGYEWENENILTNNGVHEYFVATTHEKIYYVSRSGAYRLANATDRHYVRYVINVNKDLIKKEQPAPKTEEQQKNAGQE